MIVAQLVVDSFSNIRDQIQHHDSTDVDSWHRHLHAMHSQLTDIVNIADKVLSLSTRRGLDASQIFWWVQQRAKAFYREGSEFRHAIRCVLFKSRHATKQLLSATSFYVVISELILALETLRTPWTWVTSCSGPMYVLCFASAIA